ncbi:MAG: restriction endonuclease, SacI family [Blastocatellia bacterium]
MVKKIISPNVEEARNLLDELWAEVQTDEGAETIPEFDRLIDCNSVSIRFCLPTQVLGKLTDQKLDCLCLQKGDGESESLWDPRGFANKVLVPWVMANQNVLGTSVDPYVSLPLRKPRLESDPGKVKGKDDWVLLYKILENIEVQSDPANTREAMRSVLRSIKRKLAESTFEYIIPERISLDQTQKIVAKFLAESSGGDRGLAVAAALFKTFGTVFGIYSEVRRYVINASDTSTGSAADIECLDENGNLRLAIEVKERNLTLIDVKSAVLKARKSSIQEFLFHSPRINPVESADISEIFEKTWASGTNFYQLSIDELVKVGLSLTGELGRKDFLENVGTQLNEFNTQPKNRQRWKVLLEEI